MSSTTIRIEASKYADHDDCLTAAAADVARERGLEGWDLAPRWEDEDERVAILVDVPYAGGTAEAVVRGADLPGPESKPGPSPTEARHCAQEEVSDTGIPARID